MKECIDPSESPGAQMGVLLQRFAARAARDIEKIDDSTERRVHRIRTDMKKIRSMLRLIRGSVAAPELFDALRMGAAVKDALAETRDAHVRAGIKKKSKQKKPQRAKVPKSQRKAAAEHARRLAECMDAIPFSSVGMADLDAVLEVTFQRGRHRMELAMDSPEDTAGYHEWRKRVKDLWYQAAALRHVSAEAALWWKPARALSELLGREHDLAALSDPLLHADELRDLRAEIVERGCELYSPGRLQ